MRSKSYTELRRTLAATLDSVVDDHAPVLITRRGGRPAVVLMSAEDFAAWEETAYLLSSPRNAAAIAESLRQVAEGDIVSVALDDLLPKGAGRDRA
ncbi:MAG: type II toxin-antitoxin system Phd/YefM family antitoxin [Bauldia sp.]|jgi:antitoxin YefM